MSAMGQQTELFSIGHIGLSFDVTMGSCAPIPAVRDLGENATHYEGVKVTDRERSRLQLGKAVVIRLEPLAEFIRIRSALTTHEDLFPVWP
jgi:hypothetical protein